MKWESSTLFLLQCIAQTCSYAHSQPLLPNRASTRSICVQVSEFTEPAWHAAWDEYERRMAPIEQRMAQKLKELFGACV